MIGAVSISGFPLFSGFISKTITIAGVAEAHHTWLALGLEIAAVGTFLSVGIKLPYFAFFAKPDSGIPLKKIPWNMYAAMGIAGFLCFLIGIKPDLLYGLLPHELEYEPYTKWHVLQSMMILCFTGLGFYIMRKKLTPEAKRNADFDYLYRVIGKSVVAIARKPIELIDNLWSEFYAKVGLKGMLKMAGIMAWFDKAAIDGVVDGTALGVKRIGNSASNVQTGNLQNYLALAMIIGVVIFAAVWFG